MSTGPPAYRHELRTGRGLRVECPSRHRARDAGSFAVHRSDHTIRRQQDSMRRSQHHAHRLAQVAGRLLQPAEPSLDGSTSGNIQISTAGQWAVAGSLIMWVA
jgi:hypothetical protein